MSISAITVSAKNDPEAYFGALTRSGMPATDKNRKICKDVVAWLESGRVVGEFVYAPSKEADPERHATYVNQIVDQYRKEKYGSVWMLLAWVAVRVIITLIIEAYFS